MKNRDSKKQPKFRLHDEQKGRKKEKPRQKRKDQIRKLMDDTSC